MKEFQHIILLLQRAGKNYHPMFCSCNVQEEIITRCFAPATCRKELSLDVLLLQCAGRNYHSMFCSCNVQEEITV